MDRKKILVMSDSPKLHTGFAKVAKEIFTYLNRTGKYDIKCIGWFHQETNEEVTYQIFQTMKDEKGRLTQEDKYGHKSFPDYVEKFKPDLVWTLGDMWMIDHIATAPNRDKFKWVGYFPIDGHPSPSKWGPIVEGMDVAVAYGKYGMDVIKQRAPRAKLQYVYHGVDTKAFHPIDKQSKLESKMALIGAKPDQKIIGIVARNQPRKAFDKLFEAYFYILNGAFIKCNKCSKITVFPYDIVKREIYRVDRCKHCLSADVVIGKERDDVRLYVHGAIVDCGWDLLDLQNDYNLRGKVLVNPALKIGVGVSEHTLNAVYNAFDVFTLPTRGEGFGLPILEAMACGIPVVATDYSAHPEWASEAGIMVKPAVLESEPLTNIRRAVIDMSDYVEALITILDNPEVAKKYGAAGRRKALDMDWSTICSQWENIIDGVLFPDGKIPEKVSPSKVKYNLEEM